jgi:hypothetical protein
MPDIVTIVYQNRKDGKLSMAVVKKHDIVKIVTIQLQIKDIIIVKIVLWTLILVFTVHKKQSQLLNLLVQHAR